MSSYGMSPPQKPAPTPFSPPYPSSGSPTNANSQSGYGQPPPAKRPRLSPDARSPVNGNGPSAPPYNSTQNANRSYGNPYAAQSPAVVSPYAQSNPSQAYSPQSSFNTPQAYQSQHPPWQSQPSTPSAGPSRQTSPPNMSQQTSSQMMPPPPRPNKDEREERVGVDEIGDSLFGSGINIRDEENYLHSTFSNRHGDASFATSAHTNSFASNGSHTFSPNNSFNQLKELSSYASQPGGALAGTLGAEKPRTQEDIEKEAESLRRDAARSRNERLQHHLNKQFLQVNVLRAKLDKRARDNGMQWNLAGLYKRQDPSVLQSVQGQTQTMVNGTATEGIAAVVDTRPEYTVEPGQPTEHLLALLSLAAGERIRGLLGEAFALARARQYGDHGRVPPEFADIAVAGTGAGKRVDEEVVPQSASDSQWDKIPGQGDVEMADDHLDDHPDGEKGTSRANDKPSLPQGQATIAFHSAVALRLRALAEADRKAEQERIKKREARRKALAEGNGPAGTATTVDGETPNPDGSAPDTPADAAAPLAATKVSKKEQQKREKEARDASQAQAHLNVNQAAALAVGKKGNRYSWMSGGAAQPLINRFQKTAAAAAAKDAASGGSANASGTATPTGGNAGLSAAASPGGAGMARSSSQQSAGKGAAAKKAGGGHAQWGDWRETPVGGKDIDVRDWILVLERDGKEGMALQRVFTKLT